MKKLRSTDCTQSEFAAFIGRSSRWVRKMIQDGQIPRADREGRMKTWPAVHAYITTLQDALKAGGSESTDITSARSRLELARAEEKELEVAKLKGEVVLTEDVQNEWMNLTSNFRARMLTLPSVIAAQGVGMERGELQALAQRLVEKSLKELSEGEPLDEQTVATDSKPAKAKTSRKTGDSKRKATTKADSQ